MEQGGDILQIADLLSRCRRAYSLVGAVNERVSWFVRVLVILYSRASLPEQKRQARELAIDRGD